MDNIGSSLNAYDETAIKEILKDLTFNESSSRKLSNCPFILLDKVYFISSSFITSINPSLTIIGALNKSDKKHIYDNSVTHIEDFWTNKIYDILLQKSGFQVFYKKNYSAENQIVSPDFVVINKEFKEFVIIEYKHFVKPTTVAETLGKQNGIDEAIEQLNRYLEFFKKNPCYKEFGIEKLDEYKTIPIILLREPIPVVTQNHKVNFLSYWNLQKLINRVTSFEEFIEKSNPISERPELEIDKFITEDNEIKVGEWTYIYQEMAISDEQDT